jgi:hypothetical protein
VGGGDSDCLCMWDYPASTFTTMDYPTIDPPKRFVPVSHESLPTAHPLKDFQSYFYIVLFLFALIYLHISTPISILSYCPLLLHLPTNSQGWRRGVLFYPVSPPIKPAIIILTPTQFILFSSH